MSGQKQVVVAVDARVLSQAGKGVPRFLYETLQELVHAPSLRLKLFSNRPLHPRNALPLETIIDEGWGKVPGTVWMLSRLNRLALVAGAEVLWGPAHVLPLRANGLRTVLTVHDLVHRVMPRSMSSWNRWVSRLLVDASIRRADTLVADSESTRSDIETYVEPRERIDVVRLGTRSVAERSVSRVSEQRHISGVEEYLFALGSIEPRKNIDGLLHCFDALRHRLPELSLRLTGAHSWGSSQVLRRISENQACRLLGFLSDAEIADQMAGARAFIMPSHYEGFGLPIIEAVGLAPIIASDIPVFRELGRFIEGIHYVDFSDRQRAAEAIAEVLAQYPPPARFRPGAEQQFTWREVARSYAAALSAARDDA